METSVVRLSGSSPVIRVPVTAAHAPNVYVSVLAIRPRLREVRWYSFFSWGWREPRNWLADFRAYQAPGPTVDLARPAFRFGVAEIGVGAAAHRLGVRVGTPQTSYPVRGRALATVQVTLPDGRPAAGAEVALAAVDEALLELQPNDSWDLLPAMLQRRSYGVQTATAQLQIVGKRHYGRKAMPPGGGGGRALTRELLDTLLLWQPAVVLDAEGRAQVEVPLNDALSGFRIVAVATSGAGLFGTGATSIRTTQDLQLISRAAAAGAPGRPVQRDGDRAQWRRTGDGYYRCRAGRRQAAGGRAAPHPACRGRSAGAGMAGHRACQRRTAGLGIAGAEGGGGGREGCAEVRRQKLLPAVPVTVQQATCSSWIKAAASSWRRRPAPCRDAAASRSRWRRRPGRGGGRPAPLFQRLSIQLPGAESVARSGAGRPWRLAAAGGGIADLSRQRWPGALFPGRQRRRAGQPGADRLPAGAGARSRLAAAGRQPRAHAARPAGVCRRPHRAAATGRREGHRHPPAVGAGSAVALWQAAAARTRRIQIAPGLWPTSALLDWIAILRRTPGCRPQARGWTKPAGAARPPEFPGHAAWFFPAKPTTTGSG